MHDSGSVIQDKTWIRNAEWDLECQDKANFLDKCENILCTVQFKLKVTWGGLGDETSNNTFALVLPLCHLGDVGKAGLKSIIEFVSKSGWLEEILVMMHKRVYLAYVQPIVNCYGNRGVSI